jgi:hypothetical protein
MHMRKWIWILTPIIVVTAAWWVIRPGVFTVQPLGVFPEGITIVYHSRGPDMPFFASPDGLCLKLKVDMSLLCRGIALAAVEPLTERILFRLPYSHCAYLASTGGYEFDR